MPVRGSALSVGVTLIRELIVCFPAKLLTEFPFYYSIHNVTFHLMRLLGFQVNTNLTVFTVSNFGPSCFLYSKTNISCRIFLKKSIEIHVITSRVFQRVSKGSRLINGWSWHRQIYKIKINRFSGVPRKKKRNDDDNDMQMQMSTVVEIPFESSLMTNICLGQLATTRRTCAPVKP